MTDKLMEEQMPKVTMQNGRPHTSIKTAQPKSPWEVGSQYLGSYPAAHFEQVPASLSNPQLGQFGPSSEPLGPQGLAGFWSPNGASLHAQNSELPANWNAQRPPPQPFLSPQPFGNLLQHRAQYDWNWDPRDDPVTTRTKPGPLEIYRPQDLPLLPNGSSWRQQLTDLNNDSLRTTFGGSDSEVYMPRTEVGSFAIIAPDKPYVGLTLDTEELGDRLHNQRYLKDSKPFEPIVTVRKYGLHDSMTRALPLRTTDKVNAGQWLNAAVGYRNDPIPMTEGGNIGLIESHRKVTGALFRDLIGHGIVGQGTLNPDPVALKQPKTTLRNQTCDSTWYGGPDAISRGAVGTRGELVRESRKPMAGEEYVPGFGEVVSEGPQGNNSVETIARAKRGLEEINYFSPAGPALGGESGRLFGIDTRERLGGVAPEWVNAMPADLISAPVKTCYDDFRLSGRRQAFAHIDDGFAERLDPTILQSLTRNPLVRPLFSY